MTLIILTGPPSSGISSVSKLMSKHWKKCVRIDVEPLQWMINNPRKNPWEDQGGLKKQMRDVQNACGLAKNFLRGGHNVVIQDLLTQDTAQIYRKSFEALSLVIIQLLPTLADVLDREKERGPVLTEEEITVLYEQQNVFSGFDKRIDNTNLSPLKVVTMIRKYLDEEVSR